MSEENKTVESTEEDEIIIPDVKKEEDKSEEEEQQKVDESKKDESESDEDGFVKDSETVSANKHNQALRKAREAELEAAELRKQLENGGGKKKKVVKKEEEDEDEDEDFEFDDDEDEEDSSKKKKKIDIEAIVDSRVKPLQEQLNQRNADDRKRERDAFFKKNPQALKADVWQDVLDELDNFSPTSKLTHYEQLDRAYTIVARKRGINTSSNHSEVEKKKAQMASDSSEDGGIKTTGNRKSASEDFADALGEKMPPGFEYTAKK